MRSSSLVGAVFLLTLISCQIEDDKSSKSRTSGKYSNSENVPATFKVSKKRKIELKKDFSNFSSFKENINSYEVSFEAISGHYSFASVECSKGHFDREKELFFGNFDKSGIKAKLELNLSDKDPLDVEFDCKVLDRDIELENVKLNLRKSFVIEGTKNPYSLGLGFGPIETLVFDEDAILLTEGVFLNIEAKEIISRNGKIITFTEESANKTLDDQHGSSGGLIKIVTESSFGMLEVQLRGKNGGKQTRVPEPITEVPAKDPSLDGQCRGYTHEYKTNDLRCFGKDGQRGYKGHKGFDGFNGGSSGAFNYKAKKLDDLKIKVEFFPGKGSVGGSGGLGGAGGPKGIGSYLETDSDRGRGGCIACRASNFKSILGYKYPDGKPGAKGENGDAGNNGNDGANDESIVHYIVGDMIFKFTDLWRNY